MADPYLVWTRLRESVRRELQSDRDGITRNEAVIADLTRRSAWLAGRIDNNEQALRELDEKIGQPE